MKKKVIVFLLAVICLFSGLIRFNSSKSVPTSLNRDEAALAYNGYLLSETGKDEWGKSWPINLESFGDYKLIGYPAILSVLFSIFPESDFITRLPSIVAGILLSIAVYLLAKNLKLKQSSALLAAFLVAFSPIFFFFSRMAFEANVALLLFVSAMSLFLRKFDQQSKIYDSIGLILLACSLLTYNTPLLLLPLALVVLPLARGVRDWKKWLPVSLAALVLWIIVYALLAPTVSQKSGITIFTDHTVLLEYGAYREQFDGIAQLLLGNQYVYFATIIFSNFLDTLQPSFMVLAENTHPWHSLPGWGHVNWFIYSLFAFGITYGMVTGFYGLYRSLTGKVERYRFTESDWLKTITGQSVIIIYLTFIATVPAIITVDAPHATRSLFFFVMAVIVVVFFLEHITEVLKTYFYKDQANRISLVTIVMLLIVTFVQFLQYTSDYLSLYPALSVRLFDTNFSRIVQDVEAEYPEESKAVVDEAGYLYILLSWYLHVPPEEFYATVVRQLPDRIGLRYGQQVSDYHFIAAPQDKDQEEILIVPSEDGWQAYK